MQSNLVSKNEIQMYKNKVVIGYLFCLENNVYISLDLILTKRNTRGDQRITYSDISYNPKIQSCKIQESILGYHLSFR